MSSPIRAAADFDGATPLHRDKRASDYVSARRLSGGVPSVMLGVAVAGAGAALIAVLIEPFAMKGRQLPNLSAAYILATAGLAWGVAYAACRALRGTVSEAGVVARLTAAAAVWCAPLAIFLRDASEWSVLAAVILAVSMTRLFDALVLSDEPPPGVYTAPRELITVPAVPANHVPVHVGAALLVESSIVAMASGYALLASILIALPTAVWVRRLDMAHGSNIRERVFSMRVSRRLSAASVLTVIALLPHLLIGFGVAGGSDWSVVRAIEVLLGYIPGHRGSVIAAGPRRQAQGDRNTTGVIPGPVFPGVILYSEPRITELVAPPVMSHTGFLGPGRTQPYVIPFRGVYWILRRPDLPPPKTSLVMRGSPVKRGFTSNDYQPLWMDAHDNLDTLIDVRCCSAIKLEVAGTDARPNDIRIELLLENTRDRNRWMSLGVLPLTSSVSTPPDRRTLTFAMPRHPRIQDFNRFTVRYELYGPHSNHSARVAIEDFVLVPR